MCTAGIKQRRSRRRRWWRRDQTRKPRLLLAAAHDWMHRAPPSSYPCRLRPSQHRLAFHKALSHFQQLSHRHSRKSHPTNSPNQRIFVASQNAVTQAPCQNLQDRYSDTPKTGVYVCTPWQPHCETTLASTFLKMVVSRVNSDQSPGHHYRLNRQLRMKPQAISSL